MQSTDVTPNLPPTATRIPAQNHQSGLSVGRVVATFWQLPRRHQGLLLSLALLGLLVIIGAIMSTTLPDETVTRHSSTTNTAAMVPSGPLNGSFTVTIAADMPPAQLELMQHGSQITGTETFIHCTGSTPQPLKVPLTGTLLDDATLVITRMLPANSSEQILYSINTHDLQQAGIVVIWRDSGGLAQFQRWTSSTASEFNLVATSFCQRG